MGRRDRFQGKCLVGDLGHKYMDTFDGFPPKAREAIRESPFNICAECLLQEAGHSRNSRDVIRALRRMEKAIRLMPPPKPRRPRMQQRLY